jgi:hypothetical protein
MKYKKISDGKYAKTVETVVDKGLLEQQIKALKDEKTRLKKEPDEILVANREKQSNLDLIENEIITKEELLTEINGY